MKGRESLATFVFLNRLLHLGIRHLRYLYQSDQTCRLRERTPNASNCFTPQVASFPFAYVKFFRNLGNCAATSYLLFDHFTERWLETLHKQPKFLHFFLLDWAEPELYDLVISTSRVPPDVAANLIVQAVRRDRGGKVAL